MWYDGDGSPSTVWSNISLVLSNVATAVTASLGAWFLARRKVSGDSAAMFADKAGSDLLKTLLDERKVIIAEKDEAIAMMRRMMDLRMEDAGRIARTEAEKVALKERMEHCEASTLKADARVAETEERQRALAEQLMLTQMRVRNLFAELSQVDPVAASKFVRHQLDQDIAASAEAKEKHDGQ